MTRFLIGLVLLMAMSPVLMAQQEDQTIDTLEKVTTVDSTYISTYHSPLDLTMRYYNSIKYSRFYIYDKTLNQSLAYRSNENYIIGIGASYRKFTVNLGLAFSVVNNDEEQKGETKYLDLQAHYYLNRYVVDLWLSYFKSYYLSNPHKATTQLPMDSSFPIRPDIQNINASINIMRVINHRKYSLRASFVQDEWQKKSAGSFLIGGNMDMIFTKGDSSLIPSNIKDPLFFSGYRPNQYSLFSLGMSVGYGYTLVVKRHFFLAIMGSVTGGLSYIEMDSKYLDQISEAEITGALNYSGRAAFGYNSERIYIGVTNVYAHNASNSPADVGRVLQNSGNVRLNFVYRFKLKKPLNTPIIHRLWSRKDEMPDN